MLIDTHCHLTMPDFEADRSAVIQRAIDAGISHMITIGTDIEDSKRAIALAEGYEFIYAAVGIHPHDARDITDIENVSDTIKKLASKKKVVALGETGLDYHYMHSPAEIQQEHFRLEINLAKSLGLPVIVHSREAKEDTLRILKEEKVEVTGGVLHCFSGDMDMAEKALNMGLYISFSGVITFKNAKKMHDIVKAIPLNRILIETDAPFLTPVPHRGKRNEPAYVKYTAEKIADIKGISLEELGKTITDNAARLFRLII
ncbi:MAG: hydrolase TatD [Nitrospirae bacterium RBG_16_43_11]|nr:MAG: hydrolase TatD [Nitrospirae bacterium RBG_16_43_11]